MLKTKPKLHVGTEMIFEIAAALQDVLDNTWVNPDETIPLDEERAVKEQAAREKSRAEEESKQQQEAQAQKEEESMLQELVAQHESRTTRQIPISPQSSLNGTVGRNLPSGIVNFERPSCSIRTPTGRTVTIDMVHEKNAYCQGPICKVFTVRPFSHDSGDGATMRTGTPGLDNTHTPPTLALKQCYVPSSNESGVFFKRAVQSLESKLDLHMRLGSHQSVIKPLNFHIQRVFDDDESTVKGWTVSVLSELAEKRSLQETLDIVDKLDVKLVRAWSIQLIEGLQHYHRNGVAHANIHLRNVLLQRDREAERGTRKITIAMLSDGGYQRDLHVLRTGSCPQYFPLAWTAPEVANANPSEKIIPATDVWDFGRCFLQMAFGVGILSEHPSGPVSLIDELRLRTSLKALLSQIFNLNHRKRPSAWDLLHFEFFRNDDGLLEGDRVNDSVFLEASTTSLSLSHLNRSRRESVPTAVSSSRYDKDFVEDGRLGRGGFGEVFRARNKVDGQPYAIKKVKARSRGALDPVLSEVTVLSRLNHPNVVRYFASWIEDGVSIEKPDLSASSEDEYTSSVTHGGHRRIVPASSRGLDFISSANGQVVFANEGDEDGTSTDDEDVESSDDATDDDEGNSNPDGTMIRDLEATEGSFLNAEEDRIRGHEQISWTLLYIQMEYCKQEVRFISFFEFYRTTPIR